MNERWKELCEQASTEHDPVKLSELVREVTRLLEEKFAHVNKTKADDGHRKRNAA